MKWIPSFATLFLVGTVGVILYLGATYYTFSNLDQANAPVIQFMGILRLIGLAVVVGAPFLMLLKFFGRLDRKE